MKDGKRHGKGKVIYSDGSSYKGEWKEGLRDGTGTLKLRNGDHYHGEFKDDIMHGDGIYYQKDGTKIDATWNKGFKHGDGVITDRYGNQKEVIFYNDFEFHLDSQNQRCYDLLPLNICLAVSTIGVLIPLFFLDTYNKGFYICITFTITLYIGMLLETYFSLTNSFLRNITNGNLIFDEINTFRNIRPIIVFHISCYHYVSVYRNGQSRREKKHTHSASKEVHYSSWYDKSPDASSIEFAKT